MGSTNPLGYSMLNGTTSAHQWIQGQKKKKKVNLFVAVLPFFIEARTNLDLFIRYINEYFLDALRCLIVVWL